MKTMTCRQLGGACDEPFGADTFEELAEKSKEHGTEMYQKGDAAHLNAMEGMKALTADPHAVRAWFAGKQREFEDLPED